MRKRGQLSVVLVGLALTAATASVIYAVYLVEPLTHLTFLSDAEARLLDLRFRLRGVRTPPEDVVVVAIDSNSIAAIGRWPWTRSVHARLIDRLVEWKASAVAFDILFSEAEGQEEAARLRRIAAVLEGLDTTGPGAEAKKLIDSTMAEVLADDALAASFKRAIKADRALPVLAFDLVFEDDISLTGQLGAVLSDDAEQALIDFASFASRDANVPILRLSPVRTALGVRPVPSALGDWTAAIGYANPVLDSDGSLRREQMLSVYASSIRRSLQTNATQPSRQAESGEFDSTKVRGLVDAALLDPQARVLALMPLAVAAVATHLRLPMEQMQLDLTAGHLSYPVAGTNHVFPFDPLDGSAGIDYYGPGRTIRTYSYSDVLADSLTDSAGRPVSGIEAFSNRLVFIGMSDPGLSDYFSTPFTARLPGVEKHATVAGNLLGGGPIRRHYDRLLMNGFLIFATALMVGLVASSLPSLVAGAVVLVGAAMWYGITYQIFVNSGFVWNWALPGLTAFLSYGLVTAYRQLHEEREKSRIRSVFSTYMSPAAVDDVLSQPGVLQLGGARRECTIFFSDLVGFTTVSESLADPQKLVLFMNRYLGRMTAGILNERGILDKYIGDAIMAIFGAPIASKDHAAQACRAALSNMAELKKLQVEFLADGLPPIDCRIGINTGLVVVGNMGSELRMDYTALGDPVNLASRLEGANKAYGSHIMVGPATHAQASAEDPQLLFRPLDLVAVKGKHEPVEVFELLGLKDAMTATERQLLEIYSRGLGFYRARAFSAALSAFEEAARLGPTDGPSQTYIDRCRLFLESPPPDDWDGVFRLSEK